jgi:hypothetical protein
MFTETWINLEKYYNMIVENGKRAAIVTWGQERGSKAYRRK